MNSNTQTGEYLRSFHEREDRLLARLKAFNKLNKKHPVTLPERLSLWRLWIGDSAIYLNELSNFVSALENSTKKIAGQSK